MNTAAVIISENVQAELSALQKRMKKLRTAIGRERLAIEKFAKDIQKDRTEAANQFEHLQETYYKELNHFIDRLKLALKSTAFTTSEKTMIQRIISEISDELSRKDSSSFEPSDDDGNSDEETNDFFRAEIEEMVRQAREQEKQDPFSHASLNNLKEMPDDVSLRRLYLELSKKVHPDLALNEKDRQYRTAVMQQVTEAYRRRDLASLISIEESLVISSNDITESKGEGEQVSWCKSVIAQLEKQLSVLKKHHQKMKRSKTGQTFRQRQRIQESEMGLDLEPEIAHFTREISKIRVTLERVLSGKIKKGRFMKMFIEQFFEGDEEEELEELEQFFMEMAADFIATQSKKSKKHRRR